MDEEGERRAMGVDDIGGIGRGSGGNGMRGEKRGEPLAFCDVLAL